MSTSDFKHHVISHAAWCSWSLVCWKVYCWCIAASASPCLTLPDVDLTVISGGYFLLHHGLMFFAVSLLLLLLLLLLYCQHGGCGFWRCASFTFTSILLAAAPASSSRVYIVPPLLVVPLSATVNWPTLRGPLLPLTAAAVVAAAALLSFPLHNASSSSL